MVSILVENEKKNIIFVGLPGSGKTSFGKYAAEKIGIPFVDTDDLIEETLGETIPQIFQKRGEEFFRFIERDIIKKVSAFKNTIIATGGGAWLQTENRVMFQKNGIVIYLTCDLEELWRRLQKDSPKRPLLKKGPASLQKLYKERHQRYLQADYIIDTTKKSFAEIWEEISVLLNFSRVEKSNLPGKVVEVAVAANEYQVFIRNGLRFSIAQIIEKKYCATDGFKPRIFLITNPLVKAICGDKILNDLTHCGFETYLFLLPEGEEYKSLEWVKNAYKELIAQGFDRGDLVLGVGGGVVGDFAGFVAATYMRGMSLVQVPTTLLAQVDASIGGKTAVNLPEGKNLVGVFYQPDAVLADLGVLEYLSQFHYRQGLAECIKYGIIGNKKIFDFFESNVSKVFSRDLTFLKEIVFECCNDKAKIVSEDEKEKGLRAVLNLGHTIGHALEAAVGYGKLGHGDAVALGIRAEGYLSSRLGKLPSETLGRIENLLDLMGFPSKVKFSLDDALEYLQRDKKKKRGEIRFVLPVSIGEVEVVKGIDIELVTAAFRYVKEAK